MLLEIPALLNEAQVEKLQGLLTDAVFVDGKLTAGKVAAKVKVNEEIAQQSDLVQRVNRILMPNLAHSSQFRSFALPLKMADFIVARYKPGMHYGDHVDDPIMGTTGPKFRTDVSMTIFLNEPDTYGGG